MRRALRAAGPLRADTRRRLVLSALLVVVGLWLGGAAGVLLGIFVVLLVVDALIPLPGATWSEADDRFWRLEHARRHAGLRAHLRGATPARLDVLDDGAGWAAVAERHDLGVCSIPIASITGTAEESRAHEFDRRFRPDRSAHARWRSIWMAQSHGAALPPISVFRVDGTHIVRDGHHRVSVALDLGATTIDAEVVELVRPAVAGRV